MKTPIADYLDDLLDDVRDRDAGAVADYIPDLADAPTDRLAAAVCTINGVLYTAGDDDVEFSMQSISKAFTYALALEQHGLDKLLEIVGMEPSGEAFNELSLDDATKRPMNPMINAGAIAVNQVIDGEEATVENRTETLRRFYSRLAGRELRIDEGLVESELGTSDRNMAIAYMLRSYGIVRDSARDAVESYVRQCAVMVTVSDLAVMGATLANGGVQPVTGEQIIERRVAQLVQAVMSSAGMYDAAGRWMATVGIPAKSGVSGGLLGTLPGQLGLATFSPRLDAQGNSERGKLVFQRFSHEGGMHLMSAETFGGAPVRVVKVVDDVTVFVLQGSMDFNGAEVFLRTAETHEFRTDTVCIDIHRVNRFNRIARTMTLEGMRRMREDGLTVQLLDPEGVLEDPDLGDGTYPEIVRED
ncbi:glutaminase [Corynebacterium bovis]|uniref:Glutaminase n=1 Tax=Corynebacterium bovis TaxID=36808 RepID=A0A426PZD8_9CORY|nr:glutaminase [Corynebacterium bovis]MDK8510392.1 glutaminase [Corynebacterium bovis]MDN8579512.1 glutaminase [Corynebacterium bovis]RRO87065.1 glutaminase [Corynebacterium bovis]RRO90083.1 glutaminase [Corynebacterium bovis]